MINPHKAVEWYRKKNPSTHSWSSDYEVYERLKRTYPDYEFAANPFQASPPASTKTYHTSVFPTGSGSTKILIGNPVEFFTNVGGWAGEQARKTYNESMAGMTYEAMHGRPKYEVNNKTDDLGEEVAQFFFGLASPLDALTLFASGQAGKLAVKGGSGAARKLVAKQLLPKSVAKKVNQMSTQTLKNVDNHVLEGTRRAINKSSSSKLFANPASKNYSSQLAYEGALGHFGNLATYTTAQSFLSNAVEQKREIAEKKW